MKLATFNDGSRDGQLVVVARDLQSAHFATGIAGRLQQALDDWNFIAPQLEQLYTTLNRGRARHAFALDPRTCMAPLPRAYCCGGDNFLGPRADAIFASEEAGISCRAAIAAVTGDVAMGATAAQALEGVRLLLLVNAWVLRDPPLGGLAGDLEILASQPGAAFGPVAVTPDELGGAWKRGRVHLPLQVSCNGVAVDLCDAGALAKSHFGQLIAQVAKTRNVRAGAIIAAPPATAAGRAKIESLKFGDTVRFEVNDIDGSSVFGAIEQKVVASAHAE